MSKVVKRLKLGGKGFRRSVRLYDCRPPGDTNHVKIRVGSWGEDGEIYPDEVDSVIAWLQAWRAATK